MTDLRPDRAGAARAGLTARTSSIPHRSIPTPRRRCTTPSNDWPHGIGRCCSPRAARLDRADDRRVAVALCADAGLDTAATAAALIGVGADPVSCAAPMKQATIVNDEGERRCMFDNVDAAFRVGDRPPGLDVETAARLEQLDVDDVEPRRPSRQHPATATASTAPTRSPRCSPTSASPEPTPRPRTAHNSSSDRAADRRDRQTCVRPGRR